MERPGVELRLLNAVALYVAGDLEGSLRAAETPESPPPDVAAARLAAVSCYAAVAGGSPDAARRLDRLRGSWDADPQVALVAGGCEADLLTWEGDPAGAVDVADRAQTPPGRRWPARGRTAACGCRRSRSPRWPTRRRPAAAAGTTRGRRGGARGDVAAGTGRAARRRRPRPPRGPRTRGAGVARPRAGRARSPGRRPGGRGVAAGARRLRLRPRPRAGALPLAAVRRPGPRAVDRDAARTHARAAAAAAERMRAVPLQRAVAATVSRERLAARQSAVDAVLTEREREVLALVAEGLTNREIGSRLFISAKTASVHLSNLMAKLNVSSRTEAVTVAQRRGLLDVR